MVTLRLLSSLCRGRQNNNRKTNLEDSKCNLLLTISLSNCLNSATPECLVTEKDLKTTLTTPIIQKSIFLQTEDSKKETTKETSG